MKKVIRINALVFCVTICVGLFTEIANAGCADIFRSLESSIPTDPYIKDFGNGVYIEKVSSSEFRLNPPPAVANSAREAQRLLLGSAKSIDSKGFTVLFSGFTVGEVYGFKQMLYRDQKIESDARLSMVLLGESVSKGDRLGYEGIRNTALVAREHMTTRYNWSAATIQKESSSINQAQEVYRLSVEKDLSMDKFLLTLKLRSKEALKNRVQQIKNLLFDETYKNATVEQTAHSLIRDLKRADPGISDGSLKVMAADFVISKVNE